MAEVIKIKNQVIKALTDGLCTRAEAEEYCAKLGITL